MKEKEEEEEGMLENKNSSTPTTSHKSRIWKTDAVPKPHKSNTSIVAVDDDDDDDKEEIFEAKTLDTRELKTDKGEDKSMSSSLCRGRLEEESGRERLKRHRVEVAGQVWIPDTWGQEDLLKDWTDCSAFDSALVPQGIISARAALAEAATARRRTCSGRLGVENSC